MLYLLRDVLIAVFAFADGAGAQAEANWPRVETGTDRGIVTCEGILQEGGLMICRTAPDASLRLTDTAAGGSFAVSVQADAEGLAVVGLPRSMAEQVSVVAEWADPIYVKSYPILDRQDDYRVIEGLECDKVDARTQAQKDHAGRSWVKKQAAFKTFEAGDGPLNGFSRPATGRTSSPFGPTRKYVGLSSVTGEPCDRTSVHRGYDIAAPIGTDIAAPAPGIVTLADPDLYYEGGTVFLDHGHGLTSVFMHMSRVDVAVGDEITAGAKLGEVGNTGRTTGPHLHWAVKWRNPASDDRGGDFYIDPALLLTLEPQLTE